MRMARTLPLAALTLALAYAAPKTASAEVFAYRDDRGILHFSNVRETPRWIPLIVPPFSSTRTFDHLSQPYPFASIVGAHARRTGIDAALVRAIIKVESDFDPRARSHKGAIGLMQVLPETAALYGRVNLYEPAQNIRVGIRHLKHLLAQFRNDMRLALAAYNAGAAAVNRYGGVPPFPETIDYVARVLGKYSSYKSVARTR